MHPREEATDDDDDSSNDQYYDGTLTIAYDAEDRVASIELSAGGDLRPVYRDIDLFDSPVSKAVSALEKDGPFDPDAPEMPFTFVFPALELALERSDEADDATFERLTMGGEGFYSQREVDPETFGFDGSDRAGAGNWDEDSEVDEEEELEEEGFSTADGSEEEESSTTSRSSSLFEGAGLDDEDDEEFDDLGEQELDFDSPEGIDWSDDEDDDWLREDDDD